jgi:hypothetical protein
MSTSFFWAREKYNKIRSFTGQSTRNKVSLLLAINWKYQITRP